MNSYLGFELCFEVEEDLASSFRFDGSLTIFESRTKNSGNEEEGGSSGEKVSKWIKKLFAFCSRVCFYWSISYR